MGSSSRTFGLEKQYLWSYLCGRPAVGKKSCIDSPHLQAIALWFVRYVFTLKAGHSVLLSWLLLLLKTFPS
jgi:hypothetical protein